MSARGSRSPGRRRRPGQVHCVAPVPGGPAVPHRPGGYLPLIVIVIIVVLAIIAPPGQVATVLYALAAALAALRVREVPT